MPAVPIFDRRFLCYLLLEIGPARIGSIFRFPRQAQWPLEIEPMHGGPIYQRISPCRRASKIRPLRNGPNFSLKHAANFRRIHMCLPRRASNCCPHDANCPPGACHLSVLRFRAAPSFHTPAREFLSWESPPRARTSPVEDGHVRAAAKAREARRGSALRSPPRTQEGGARTRPPFGQPRLRRAGRSRSWRRLPVLHRPRLCPGQQTPPRPPPQKTRAATGEFVNLFTDPIHSAVLVPTPFTVVPRLWRSVAVSPRRDGGRGFAGRRGGFCPRRNPWCRRARRCRGCRQGWRRG